MTRDFPEDLTLMDMILDLSAGNPGAISVIMELMSINRYDLIGYLYQQEIRGSDIWIIYKDENNQDMDELVKDLELKMLVSATEASLDR